MFDTPILFLIYNRPDTTKQVFEKIKKIKPKKLFIAADGPKKNKENELELCLKTRKITENIDWDCDIQTLFREKNLRSRMAVSSAIDWFFANVEEGIIFEDDCLPDLSFFRFCAEMLKKFRQDKRIMMVGGINARGKWKNNIQSYHFSYFGHNWGWATWKRAWDYFDVDIDLWEKDEVKKKIKDVIGNKLLYEIKKKDFDDVYKHLVDAWDYQWLFARLYNSGLTVVPSVNLIKNIGLYNSSRIKNISSRSNRWAKLSSYSLQFPLIHNDIIVADRAYSNSIRGNIMMLKGIIKNRFKKFFKK